MFICACGPFIIQGSVMVSQYDIMIDCMLSTLYLYMGTHCIYKHHMFAADYISECIVYGREFSTCMHNMYISSKYGLVIAVVHTMISCMHVRNLY